MRRLHERLLVRAVEYHGLRVIEIDNDREVFGDDDFLQRLGPPNLSA
jgi:hypothetical protein